VSEFTHETAEDGFHEIQLSGKQLVFLFIVTTTVIVVVFLCGVKVGRGARAAQADDPDQGAAAAAVSQPQPAAPAAPLDSAAPTEAPAPPGEAPDLSYPDRLKGTAPPDEKLKAQPDPEPAAKPDPAPKAAPPALARQSAAPGPADVPTSGRAGTWVVQVIATRDRGMATSIVKRLRGKEYPAFLVDPASGPGPGYYKVHVGRYSDRGEAERVSQRIKKEEQFQSWITR
jgi:hypothetical protein